MAAVSAAASVAASLIFTPFLMFMLCVIFLASIGKSLGVRRLYVDILLKIFEYGRQHIEVAKRLKREEQSIEESEPQTPSQVPQRTWSSVTRRPPTHVGNGHAPTSNGTGHTLATVIKREDLILAPDPGLNIKKSGSQEKLSETQDNAAGDDKTIDSSDNRVQQIQDFDLSGCLEYVKAGVEAIIEDQVTSVFEAEELRSWNLLTRTNRHYEFISWRLTIIWMMGFVVRYFFLLPLRILICFVGVVYMVVAFGLVGQIPSGRIKRSLSAYTFQVAFRIMTCSLSGMVKFHNYKSRPQRGGFCVANHTTPIDVVVLSTKTCFSLIGQRHSGFLGLLERALARASPHIWFERSESKDRVAVAKRLKEHVSDPNNPPILIFPEGTCINNTSVMQFKKGSFEVGGVIYPVAIKYDPRFGDAFWNSSRYGMLHYLYMMMSSWAIVCDVWYLPPMYRQSGESAIDFANRVKAVIAKQGGLVDLMWDGQLKRMQPKKELKELQQEEFSKRLKGE